MPFPAALPAEIDADPWRLRLLSDADWMLAWTMSRDPDVVRWTLYPPEMTEEAAHRRSRRITESGDIVKTCGSRSLGDRLVVGVPV